MIQGHGGNIYRLAEELRCDPAEIRDMSSNVNPLGPPPGLREYLRENVHLIQALPEADACSAVQSFCRKYGLSPRNVLAGNGSTQFIYFLPLALRTKQALIVGPTYADYEDACAMHGALCDVIAADREDEFRPDLQKISRQSAKADTVFICNPNNPTGSLIPGEDLLALCRRHPDTRFIIDESYLPFVPEGEEHSLLHSGLSNVLVLHSMSKIFRVPGLRIGFLIGMEQLIAKMRHYSLPWSLSNPALHTVIWLMDHGEITDAFISRSREYLSVERKRFCTFMSHASHMRLFPGCTSFILAELKGRHNSGQICAALAAEKILIRNCANFRGLSDRFIRISLKTEESNRMLLEKLSAFA
ncbi:MAG: threonine-phosphate decarboxylase [Desulfococcaceae bacterium]|jgi:threonine-phosphate decarboxylase|nr:threonine-phosphate decarboxylase [Desulfococcaceae bacterium]